MLPLRYFNPRPIYGVLCTLHFLNIVDDASNIQHLELQQASPKKGKKKGGNQQQKSGERFCVCCANFPATFTCIYDFSNSRIKILGPSMNGSRGSLTGLSAHDLITTIKSVPLEAAETQVRI